MSKLRHRESWYSRTKKELEEMDYKEKYRIALDKAKEIYEGQLGTATRIFLEQIFPELKESEDERIIKFLKHAATLDAADELFQEYGVKHTQVISWLDKQKERRAYWELYKGVSESEWFKENYKGKSLGEEQPAELTPLATLLSNYLKNDFEYFAAKKWDETRWNETLNIQASELLRYAKKELEKEQKPEWSEEDEKMIKSILFVLESFVSHSESASSPSLITTYPTYHKEIDWLKSLRPQPKEERSDYITSNKKFFQWIYDRLVYVHKENPNMDYMMSFKKRIDNLVFDQSHWKPSEEQMEALQRAVNKLAKTDVADSVRLSIMYDNLKKLM